MYPVSIPLFKLDLIPWWTSHATAHLVKLPKYTVSWFGLMNV